MQAVASHWTNNTIEIEHEFSSKCHGVSGGSRHLILKVNERRDLTCESKDFVAAKMERKSLHPIDSSGEDLDVKGTFLVETCIESELVVGIRDHWTLDVHVVKSILGE